MSCLLIVFYFHVVIIIKCFFVGFHLAAAGMLLVDFVPDLPMEEVKYILIKHKDQLGVFIYS